MILILLLEVRNLKKYNNKIDNNNNNNNNDSYNNNNENNKYIKSGTEKKVNGTL